MKMQLTTLAAAIAFATSMAANAQPVTDPNNLDYVGAKDSPPNYGVDNNTTNKDNKAWKHFPPSGTFNTSVYGVYSFKAINNDTFTSELNSMAPSVAASGTNESTIDQTTQNGGAAHGNAASVIQSGGSQNESNITQNKRGQGDALQAEVVQNGNKNRSDVKQDLSFGATAKVYQDGDRNLSRVTQLGADNNGAEVNQTGNDHRSIVEQGTNPGGADNNNAFVTQNNTANQSFVRQQWDNNLATVNQNGNNGMSQIWQQSDSNMATLTDTGSDNTSYIRQGDQGHGDSNRANVEQHGISGLSHVYQYGDSNIAEVTQRGDGDVSWIIQSGDNKKAIVEQKGSGTAGAEFNESYILQQGSGAHIAEVTQYHDPSNGYNNVSTVTQLGATIGNATVIQNGAGNRASTIQY